MPPASILVKCAAQSENRIGFRVTVGKDGISKRVVVAAAPVVVGAAEVVVAAANVVVVAEASVVVVTAPVVVVDAGNVVVANSSLSQTLFLFKSKQHSPVIYS